jgi:hypothetical protein
MHTARCLNVKLGTHYLIDRIVHLNLVWDSITVYGLPYFVHCVHHFPVIDFPGVIVIGDEPCQGWHKAMLELITIVSTMREVILGGSGFCSFGGLDQIVGMSYLCLDHTLGDESQKEKVDAENKVIHYSARQPFFSLWGAEHCVFMFWPKEFKLII